MGCHCNGNMKMTSLRIENEEEGGTWTILDPHLPNSLND